MGAGEKVRMSNRDSYMGSPDNPRTAAFVCYITIIGWLISYFWLYPSNKNALTTVHMRQSLFLHLATYLINILLYYLMPSMVLYFIVITIVFIFWAIGAMDAINGKTKVLPFVGEFAQDLFKRI